MFTPRPGMRPWLRGGPDGECRDPELLKMIEDAKRGIGVTPAQLKARGFDKLLDALNDSDGSDRM